MARYITALAALQRQADQTAAAQARSHASATSTARDLAEAADVSRSRNIVDGNPAAGPPGGFNGDGLFVVGLDLTPGVYRTAGPTAGRDGYLALLKSTSTRDIIENINVAGPATITVGPEVRAVEVRRCQPWFRLGDNLDAVIAAASKKGKPAR